MNLYHVEQEMPITDLSGGFTCQSVNNIANPKVNLSFYLENIKQISFCGLKLKCDGRDRSIYIVNVY